MVEDPFDFFMKNVDRLKFTGHFRDLADALKRHGWKMKLTVWDDLGEEWELTPRSAVRTKRATLKGRAIDVTPSRGPDGDTGDSPEVSKEDP